MSVLSDTEFGLSVFNQLPSDESVVFSPASYSLALALIHAGASGKTKKEIRKVLVGGDCYSDKLRMRFYKSLAESLSKKSDCLLKLGTCLYIEGHSITDSYDNANKKFKKFGKPFEARIEQFYRFDDPLDVASALNRYISAVTEGALTSCMDPRGSSYSDLSSFKEIRSVLVNTIYFEGKWKDQFYSNDVREYDFHVKEGVTNKVEFMEQSEVKRLYAATDDVEVLTLPYQDEKYTFTIILPKNRFGLGTVRAGLTAKKLQELLQSVKETCIDISIPKFKMEMETDATKILKALGVKRAFSEGAELKTYAKNLWINMIHHNAIIEINENGTKPGNVCFNKEKTSTSKSNELLKFVADHPFLFFICWKDKIIFSGQYMGHRRKSWEHELYEPVNLGINPFVSKISDTQFALSFLKHLPNDESVIFSPTSIAFALSLVHSGAKDNVKHEIRRALLGDVSDEQLVNYYRFMYASIQEKSSAIVRIANRMFVRNGFEVLNSYKVNIAKNYAAEAENLDFNNAEDSAEKINVFVKKTTDGMIPQCISPSAFDSETNVILTNAIYFEAAWAHRFMDFGSMLDFQVKEGVNKEVESLFKFEVHEMYGETEEVEVLTLFYVDNKYSFTIILPKTLFGLAALRDNLNAEKLQELFNCVERTHINLIFPKFMIETEPDVTMILKNLRVSTMFSKEEANLEGIASNVWISEVKHKAIIEVNENGTKAAGITYHAGCGFAGSDEPIKANFKADHPFLFFIRREDKILFSGQYCG